MHKQLTRMARTLVALALVGALGPMACASEQAGGSGGAAIGLEIAGTWQGGFGTETITETTWTSGMGTVAIARYDNGKNLALTQNSATDKYNPSKWNRVVWTGPTATSFSYCTVAFGLDSLALAEASTLTADPASPDQGCGGFPWTALTRVKP
jgi:hypothetical protein